MSNDAYLTLRIAKDQLRKLDEIARKTYRKRPDLIRMSIDSIIKSEGKQLDREEVGS